MNPLPLESTSSLPIEELDRTAPKVIAQERILLLEERLEVDYKRRKIGEVIIRKTIETRMVEIPVRYEKLLIEQVSPEHKQLVEIDLSNGAIEGVELVNQAVINADFASPRLASQVLYELGKTLQHCKGVRVEIEVETAELAQVYQEWLDKFSPSDVVTPAV
jgi:hypothetical protein